MNDIIALLSVVLGSSTVATLVNVISQAIIKRKEKNDVRTEALKLLMLDSIEHKGYELQQRGYVEPNELKAFKERYSCYKALNGDGYADVWHNIVIKLPIKDV